MKLNVIYVIFCFSIWILVYLLYKFWKADKLFGLDLNTNIKFCIISIIIVKCMLAIGFYISSRSKNILKTKNAPIGKKGERGLRGESGKNAECSSGCGNDLCGKIILEHCTEIYNNWRYSNYLEKYSKGQYIKNNFIKNKINKICGSKSYKKLLSKDGAGKIDKYVKDIWTKWINIILKYENGNKFLESVSLVDVDFDSMITKNDRKFATFDNIGSPGTPSKGRESPFDELKKYDMWYWGESSISKPKVVNICSGSKKTDKKDDTELKILESNDYYGQPWESRNSRQMQYQKYRRQIICVPAGFWPVCFPVCLKDGKHYVSGLRKGDKKISVYKPKDFVDSNTNRYKPVGHVVLSGDKYKHYKGNTPCKPGEKEVTDKCYKNSYSPGNPSNSNIIVSGNVKNPVDYKPMYVSLRKRGYNKNNQGFSFWRPIPPKGYRCLGDIIQTSSNYYKPSTDLISCVPEKCVRSNENYQKLYDSKLTPSDRCRSARMCCGLETRTKDTDEMKEYGDLTIYKDNYNNFRVRNPKLEDANGKFYEIIPKGKLGDDGQPSCLDSKNIDSSNVNKRKTIDNKWIVSKKRDQKYSILNLYQ